MVRRLDDALKAYRIGDPRGEHPIWSDGGARLASGRWHEAGQRAVYAAEHYSTAMLEKLVHFGGELPNGQHYVEIHLPAGLSYEMVNPDLVPDWAAPGGAAARAFGRDWFAQGRSAVLIVPSVVARMERNFVFNAAHPEFARVKPGLETPVWWDQRLFG
ncbi:RES family NAD+ phosphorylase [Brevundimonas sp. PAMC22021]|uniref:RES family NAD+ phosphorylase n=1 Tax=Brevundimonas sp. PAMC22021 TaxID=2861285 RepID=UPI001C630061|nr:RES domain-containing protein [Brevundimonas sp. PAMC22021]QYF86562.1 RES domain-containing protein [Brevundimonas sp. PAMC22021]